MKTYFISLLLICATSLIVACTASKTPADLPPENTQNTQNSATASTTSARIISPITHILNGPSR